MAYDYLGTMDRDQFNDLVLFARKQKTLGAWQEDHAKAEIRRNDCFLVKMLKAHDVFFSGSLGVEQSLPELKDRSFDTDSVSSAVGVDTECATGETTQDVIVRANCTELDIEVPLNEPHLTHLGREDAFRLKPLSLKIPVFNLKDVLSDADAAELLTATKRQFYPSLKHQRESLEWRVRKIQDRQEQLEESWRRRNFGRDGVVERYVALLEQMFGEAEPDQTHWWNLNPKPGSSDQKRPEVIFKKDKYSQPQKDLEQAIEAGVEFQLGEDF